MIELKDDAECYVVIPLVARQLPISVYYLATLQTSITRQGTLFLWPLRNSGSDGKDYAWWSSARDAAVMAQTKWINIASNKQRGAYDISEAIGKIPEPEWPDYPMRDLMEIAFKDRLIDTVDHPVLQQLHSPTIAGEDVRCSSRIMDTRSKRSRFGKFGHMTLSSMSCPATDRNPCA
jgi:hypothetical protein